MALQYSDPSTNVDTGERWRRCPLWLLKTAFTLSVIGLLWAFFHWAYPGLTPNTIRGSIIHVTAVPGEQHSCRLWIFSSLSQKQSSLTIFNPASKMILHTIKSAAGVMANPRTELLALADQVWQIGLDAQGCEPTLDLFSADGARKILDTQSFIAKFPELGAGIYKLGILEMPLQFTIATKDGQKFKYFVAADTLFNEKALDYDVRTAFVRQHYAAIRNCFVLVNEKGSETRKNICVLRANEYLLHNYLKTTSDLSAGDAKNWYTEHSQKLRELRSTPAQAERARASYVAERAANAESGSEMEVDEPRLLAPERVFLEGLVIYQDDELAVILHQDQIAKNAARMLTCVDVEGNVRWMIPPAELFPELKQTESNLFSTIFFMKGNIHGLRAGDTFVFKLDGVGLQGFDWQTGKKLWTFTL